MIAIDKVIDILLIQSRDTVGYFLTVSSVFFKFEQRTEVIIGMGLVGKFNNVESERKLGKEAGKLM